MAAQTLKLAERPHVIVATPGRLLDHLDRPSPPALRNLRFLVLDEAGRILSTGFAPELTRVLKSLPPSEQRQTLLFSATMSDAIERLRRMACRGKASSARLFDLTAVRSTPETLSLECLFMPAQVTLSFLAHVLQTLVKLEHRQSTKDKRSHAARGEGGAGRRPRRRRWRRKRRRRVSPRKTTRARGPRSSSSGRASGARR